MIRSQGEHYLVSLASVPGSADAPSTVALLPHMAFEHVTRKTRPQLGPGSLVYARVESVGFGSGGGGSGGAAATSSSIQGVLSDNVELTCLADPAAAGPGRGKKAASEGLGPLTGGTVVPVSLGLARRLMLRRPEEEGKVVVLEELASPGAAGKGSGATAAGLSFEMAVGRNGRVWVNSDDVRTVVIVCRALRELDERRLNVEEQRKLARRLLRGQ